MDGLAFLPVPDLTNGIHLLRTLCPDDPPEAAELLDYFDSTYISGRLRQQNPAQNQAVRLVLTRSPPMFPPAIWNVHDATFNGDARTNNMCEGWNNNYFNLVGHAHPSIWRVIEWCQKEEATVHTIIQQDAVGNPPAKRTQQTCSAPEAFTEPMQRPHYWPEDHCRVLVWSWVEHQTQSPILVLKRQLTL